MKFDFTYEYLWKSVSLGKHSGDFTNFYKDENDFINFFKNFQEWVNSLKDIQISSIRSLSKDYHIHPISDDKRETIKKIIKCQHGDCRNFETAWAQRFGFAKFWQFGFKKGIRVVCMIEGETLILLFFDVHHLISPDKNYNNRNYQNNKFSVYYKESK